MIDRLFLSGLVGFASGILCRSLFFYSWYVLLFITVLAFLFLLTWLLKQRNYYLIGVAVCIGLILGGVRVAHVPTALAPEFEERVGSSTVYTGEVIKEPDIRESSQRITAKLSLDGATENILVVAPLYPEIRYGERIRVEGIVMKPEPFSTDGGRIFRYDQFLAKENIFGIIERAEVTILSASTTPPGKSVAMLLSIKHTFQEGLSRALPEPASSLASGLITGGKQGLGTALLDAFIVAGLVHIVVLSGYNVMIVAEGVLRALGFLPRKIAALAAGVTIGLFVFIAGAGAASIRAGLMAALALVARATGRTYAVVRALCVVAFLMLLSNPLLLAYDPGFQLSFLATLGLILGAPLVASKLTFIRNTFWRELCAATIAAQVSVLPLLLYQTGLFSLVSLPANLLVLPVVPLAMLLSAFAGVIGFIAPTLAPVLGLPAYITLSYIVESARFFAGLPLASFTVPQFPFWVVIGAYAVLGYVVMKMSAARMRAADIF